jgi:hypothetical protein
MITDEQFAQLMGKVDTLKLICCTLATWHPQKEGLLQLIKGHQENQDKTPVSSSIDKAYRIGTKDVVVSLAGMIESVTLAAAQMQAKPGSKDH